jgi:hypothetical protein
VIGLLSAIEWLAWVLQEVNLPLAGDMLAKLPTAPELRLAGPEARDRWMEDLGSSRPLRQLADAVPANFINQTGTLFEVEIASSNSYCPCCYTLTT